jgi:Leucine-rich repeat (LRR) protein
MKIVNLQNFEEAEISEEIQEELKGIEYLNLRSSQIENLKIERNPSLEIIDLKKTRNLKKVSVNCSNLREIHLSGSGTEILEITSNRMLDINLRGATKLKKLFLNTPYLEHIELDKEKLSELLAGIDLPNLKGINHIYKDIPAKEFIENFREIESKDIDNREEHGESCGCSTCGNKLISEMRIKV